MRGFPNGGSYEAIPLERNAYDLDTRFVATLAKPFSVEAEVEKWIRGQILFPVRETSAQFAWQTPPVRDAGLGLVTRGPLDFPKKFPASRVGR